MIKNKLIFVLLMSSSSLCLADAMCGPGGEFNPGDNQCYPVQDRRTSSPPPARRVDLWGAIAVSTSSPGAEFAASSSNHRSTSNANASAMNRCGLNTCKVIITYKNTCGAAAVDTNNTLGVGIDPVKQRAEAKAVSDCKSKGGTNCLKWSSSCSGQQY